MPATPAWGDGTASNDHPYREAAHAEPIASLIDETDASSIAASQPKRSGQEPRRQAIRPCDTHDRLTIASFRGSLG